MFTTYANKYYAQLYCGGSRDPLHPLWLRACVLLMQAKIDRLIDVCIKPYVKLFVQHARYCTYATVLHIHYTILQYLRRPFASLPPALQTHQLTLNKISSTHPQLFMHSLI